MSDLWQDSHLFFRTAAIMEAKPGKKLAQECKKFHVARRKLLEQLLVFERGISERCYRRKTCKASFVSGSGWKILPSVSNAYLVLSSSRVVLTNMHIMHFSISAKIFKHFGNNKPFITAPKCVLYANAVTLKVWVMNRFSRNEFSM